MSDLSQEQLRVVNAPIENILVSAAAGSGKTTVLVHRIVEKLCAREFEIDDILVVTFTKDAAANMKKKLEDKIKKRIHRDESEWIRVEDMHEAIISKSEFNLVQELLLRDTRVAPEKSEVFPLAGMVYCADCGEPMVRKTVPAGNKKYVYYVCSGNKRDKGTCSSHCFPEKKLIRSVTETVRTHIGKIIALSEAVEIISKTESAKPDIVKYEDRISKLREEVESCNSRKKNLYEDFKDEILSKEEYSMLRDRYQKQLDEAESCIASLEAERDMILANGSGKQEWIEKLKTYKGIKELDRSLITFLIERIDVIDGNTIQVTYRFREEAEELKRLAELYSIDMKEAV